MYDGALLVGLLRLAEVPTVGDEAPDMDTWRICATGGRCGPTCRHEPLRQAGDPCRGLPRRLGDCPRVAVLAALAVMPPRCPAARRTRPGRRLRDRPRRTTLGRVNLHDWIDELCDALDIEAEVDEGLVLDLARDAAHNVERPAAPITTYLLGFAAAYHEADPEKLERLAGAATVLAEKWDGKDLAADLYAAVEVDVD